MSRDAPYSKLSPETVLDAIEAVGFHCDGRVLALNSYENRVYQIGIEDAEPVVAKFYRPQRWSDEIVFGPAGGKSGFFAERLHQLALELKRCHIDCNRAYWPHSGHKTQPWNRR